MRDERDTYVDPVIEAFKRDVDRTILREGLRRTVDERVQAQLAMHRLVKAIGKAEVLKYLKKP
ncbi:MAG: hypothetical protein FJZ01_11735 [Candidatus Sericytochromatia bacterium]|nr:hypothetical protein [Candidatus Tanganyikabacteria bacterium]